MNQPVRDNVSIAAAAVLPQLQAVRAKRVPPGFFIAAGNRAFREQRYQDAISDYLRALHALPALASVIAPNIEMARNRLVSQRGKRPGRVAVCGGTDAAD